LANATNEGFDLGRLRKLSDALQLPLSGGDGKSLGTLGLLRGVVTKLSPDSLQDTHGVLSDLQQRRGMGKAHGAWKTPDGSLVEDADRRLSNVIRAVRKLTEVLQPLAASPKQPPTSPPGGE
jgi:hypothetical protein